MPLYDCMLMLKPKVPKEGIIELLTRVGKHVCRRNGVVTDIRSFGEVNLGYGIKKLDGRYYQAKLVQMTMMTPPNINEELRYLNKEDRLFRWILVKSRGVNYGVDFLAEDEEKRELTMLNSNPIYNEIEEKDDDENSDDDDDDEYEVGQQDRKDV